MTRRGHAAVSAGLSVWDFFRNFGDKNQQRRAASLGSGFIIDDAGIVVTNFHVIENAEEITVTLSDETVFTAEVLGQDQKTDIAVLKIDPGDTDLAAMPFGDSDSLRVGDWVLAIGNPFGLGGTVTAGIVSARGRDIMLARDFIQTDASTAAIRWPAVQYRWRGDRHQHHLLAIWRLDRHRVCDFVGIQLAEFGTTRRGWLVSSFRKSPDIAVSLGLDQSGGALVVLQ